MKNSRLIIFLGLGVGLVLLLMFKPPESLEKKPISTAVVPKAVDVPLTNNVAVVTPADDFIIITGRALGMMFFEGSFPVRLEDESNLIIAEGIVQAEGDWITTSSAPFTAKLTLLRPVTNTTPGLLIFTGDNSSGLEENDMIVNIPALIKI